MNLENDHNVYILGAGFSASGGMPLIPNFLTRMRDSHPWLESKGRTEEAKAVQEVLEFRLKATAASYWTPIDLENLEELFSLASVEESQLSLSYSMRLAIAATLDFCDQTASNKTCRISPRQMSPLDMLAKLPWLGATTAHGFVEIPAYAFYIARLLGMFNFGGQPKGENTFVTFNYDTLLEDGLHYLKIPFSYGFKPDTAIFDSSAKASQNNDERIKVLKLHGSVNWQWLVDSDNPDMKGPTIFGSYEEVRRKNSAPELVPPTWRKDFTKSLWNVWGEAIRSLHTATRIVIIGFSIPPTDVHFKSLISAGLKENISLRQIVFINPDAEKLPERAGSVFGREHISSGKVRFECHRIDGYLTIEDAPANIGRPMVLGNGSVYASFVNSSAS